MFGRYRSLGAVASSFWQSVGKSNFSEILPTAAPTTHLFSLQTSLPSTLRSPILQHTAPLPRCVASSSHPAPPPPRLFYLLRSFRRNPLLKERALGHHIPDILFTKAAKENEFGAYLLKNLDAAAFSELAELDDPEAHDVLFDQFLDYVRLCYEAKLESHKTLASSADLSQPHLWFPFARAIKRRVIYHAGPTNSGKTYNALEAMRGAASGVYCGPLRLLAMEVYDTCNLQGTLCSMVTGQERREVPGAAHIACTVEMVNLHHQVDVAVLDEIQMIGDPTRGFAWTRALLGVPANEIHVCGDASAVDLVRWLCREMDEDFELRTYDRFTKLVVEPSGLRAYSDVKKGDCIVAFSRSSIYDIKTAVEAATPHACAVIYGALPPEARRHQARLFNDPDSEYGVMVASDAVGMGLNLNIARVVFHRLHKREGRGERLVPVGASAAKQIAGRAGRRSSEFQHGRATCIDPADVELLTEHLAAPMEETGTFKAGLAPEFEQFEAFASRSPLGTQFADLLKAFEELAVLRGRYFFCRQEAVEKTAKLVQEVKGLSLRDMHTFSISPASSNDQYVMAALMHWAKRYGAGLPCPLELHPPTRVPESAEEMRALESGHAMVMLWQWLSFRFDPEFFPDRERVDELGQSMCNLLALGLQRITDISRGDAKATRRNKGATGKSRARGMQQGGTKRKGSKGRAEMSRMFAAFKEELEETEAVEKPERRLRAPKKPKKRATKARRARRPR